MGQVTTSYAHLFLIEIPRGFAVDTRRQIDPQLRGEAVQVCSLGFVDGGWWWWGKLCR